MPHRLVQPTEKTFRELIQDQNRLKVPFLQRNYVWSAVHYGKVLEDIVEHCEQDRLHFTGSIITAPIEGNGNHLQLIDGQQRMTTLVIICKAIKDCLDLWKQLVAHEGLDADTMLQVVSTPYEYGGEQKSLETIVNEVYHDINVLRFHARFLTLKGNDGDRLSWILQDRTLAEILNEDIHFRPLGPHRQGYSRIYRAYDSIFKSLLSGACENDESEVIMWFGKIDDDDGNEQPSLHSSSIEDCQIVFQKLVKILDVVNHKLLFLKMHVVNNSFIYDIFNTVNSLGHKLSRFDLLRNKVVQKIDQMGINNEQRTNIIGMLLSFSDDEVLKDNQMTKFMELYSHVQLGIFSRSSIDLFWDDWVEQNFVDYEAGCAAIQSIHQDLMFYLNLLDGSFIEPDEDEDGVPMGPDYTILNNKLQWIKLPSVKLHLPLLMNAYIRQRTPEDLHKLLEITEKVYLYWRVYEKKLPQFTKNLINSSMDGKMHKLDCQCRKCTNEDPENENQPLRIDWTEDNIDDILELMEQNYFQNLNFEGFKVSMESKNDYSTGLSKFLLWNIEERLVRLKDDEDEFADYSLIEAVLEQEHIMPKKGKPQVWGIYAEGTELNLNNLEKIGNHTLYKKVPNIKLGNKSWEIKQRHLPADNLEILLNHDGDFCENENWTETEIDERSANLIDHVVSIWFE